MSDSVGNILNYPGKTMILKLPDNYSLIDLKHWVRDCDPKMIEMSAMQRKHYVWLLRQQVFDRPLRFMGIPIEVTP